MNCPRCKTEIPKPYNPEGIIPCPGCGARLMTKAAVLRSQGGPRSAGPETDAARSSPAPEGLADHPPSETLPPPATRRRRAEKPPSSESAAAAGGARAAEPATLESLQREILALRATQQEILDLVRQAVGASPDAAPGSQREEGPVFSPVRSRRRKTVVLIDDDEKTREAAVAALQQADVPVRAVEDGASAIRAIAEEKPDVIAVELGLAGDMGGKDVVNMIKATMEWVDIPIILWTREAIDSQKEARQVHGADEIVQKASGPDALVACVITVFRRG